jgi:hypothetical protein
MSEKPDGMTDFMGNGIGQSSGTSGLVSVYRNGGPYDSSGSHVAGDGLAA